MVDLAAYPHAAPGGLRRFLRWDDIMRRWLLRGFASCTGLGLLPAVVHAQEKINIFDQMRDLLTRRILLLIDAPPTTSGKQSNRGGAGRWGGARART